MRLFILILAVLALPAYAHADIITGDDIVSVSKGIIGSGNGTLDLRVATFSGSEITNESGSFNFDNGNNQLPQGGGADIEAFDESYVISGMELKSYFILNFPDGSGGSLESEIVLFFDLSENREAAQATNNLTTLDIILNPMTIGSSPNPVNNDVTSDEQGAIDQVYTGGTVVAELENAVYNMPILNQGAGFADYGIFTGLDPYSLADEDVVLFNISMNSLNNGAEEIFLSGLYSSSDLTAAAVPEPGSLILFGSVLLIPLAGRRRRR